jgi:hypothetical protein
MVELRVVLRDMLNGMLNHHGQPNRRAGRVFDTGKVNVGTKRLSGGTHRTSERMKRPMRGFLHRSERNKANLVGLTPFLKRPANARITRQSTLHQRR